VPVPGGPGHPAFAPEVVRVIVDSGSEHEQVNEQTFDQLFGL
jgi:hypothetical protein